MIDRRLFLASTGVLVAGCSRLSVEGCPSFRDEADEHVCYRSRSNDSASSYLEPESTEKSLEAVAEYGFEFTFHNESESEVVVGPSNYQVHRSTLVGWNRVDKRGHFAAGVEVNPGDTYSWVLYPEGEQQDEGKMTVSIGVPIDEGRFAFSIGVHDQSVKRELEFVATFRIV